MSSAFEVSSGITGLANQYQGILLDAYGVFWNGNEAGLLPDSKDAMEQLVSSGKIVGILSNSTQLASKEITKLQQHGLLQEKHFHFLITSGEVARHHFLNEKLPFESPSKKFWLFGKGHPKFSPHEAIFQGTQYSEATTISEADFIYLSVPHLNGEDQTDPELFRSEIEKLKETNLPMICPNPDRFAHEGKPPKAVVRQGSIAKIYEAIGGTVYYIGKPDSKAYMTAMNCFEKYKISNPKSVLMVGDTPETDIQGANRFGMPSALIIETGMMAEQISRQGLENALNALSSNDRPNYFIGRLKNDL